MRRVEKNEHGGGNGHVGGGDADGGVEKMM